MDAVNVRSAQPSPFATFEFMRSAVQGDEFSYEGSMSELVLLVAMDGDRLAGYLPLKRTEDRPLGLRRYQLGWLIIHDGDLPRLVAAPEDEARCASAFVEYLGSCPRQFWTMLQFAGQDSESILRETVRELPHQAYYTRLFPGNSTSAIPIRWSSLREYFNDLSERRTLVQDLRRLLRDRTAEWIRSTDAASGRALFEVYLAIERRSWKHDTSAAIARSPRRIAYYRSLFNDDAPMFTHIALLVLDGLPVSAEITGNFDGVAYGLEGVFDGQSAARSPGKAAAMLTMHDAIRDGMRSLNLRWLFAYYKERWLARTTETENIQVFRRGSVHHLKAVLGEVKRRIRPAREEQIGHNPTRRGADGPALSDYNGVDAEPESARILARALASGIAVERISDSDLRAILPLQR